MHDFLTDVRAVFFDAVGTLLFPEPPAAAVYAQVGRRFGSRYDEEAVAQRFRSAFAAEEAADRAAGLRTSEAREVERWRRIVAAVLDDVTDAEGCFRVLYDHFARPAGWRCNPDAPALLRRLADRGLAPGVASNYDRRLRPVLAGFAELAPLTTVVISSEVGWRKPAPEFFAALCRAVALPPEQVLLVGDDYDNDFEGARATGLRPLLLDPAGRYDPSQPRHIRSLKDVG